MAEPGAVVDVVRAEAGADELLEEVGLLVGALRRAEAGDRARPAGGVDLPQPARHQVQGLVPGGLPEGGHDLVVVDQPAGLALAAALVARPCTAAAAARRRPTAVVGRLWPSPRTSAESGPFGYADVDADQRHGEPLRGRRVVPAVAALHAQPALRPGLGAALGEGDRAALAVDVVGQRTADPAVRADAVDGVQLLARPDRDAADRLVGQRPGRAGLHALAAGDARAGAHRVVEVERDPGRVALAGAADDVVALDVVAGPDAAVAQDAGVVVDVDDGVGRVGAPARAARQLGGLPGDAEAVGEIEQQVVAGLGVLGVLGARRLIGHQQLGQRGTAALQLRAGGRDLHAVLARAARTQRRRPARRCRPRTSGRRPTGS